jgi:hypothetical protein
MFDLLKKLINKMFKKQSSQIDNEQTAQQMQPEETTEVEQDNSNVPMASVSLFFLKDMSILTDVSIDDYNSESIIALAEVIGSLFMQKTTEVVIDTVKESLKDNPDLLELFMDQLTFLINQEAKTENNRKDTEDEPYISPIDALK